MGVKYFTFLFTQESLEHSTEFSVYFLGHPPHFIHSWKNVSDLKPIFTFYPLFYVAKGPVYNKMCFSFTTQKYPH